MKYVSNLPPEQAEAILAMYECSKGASESCAPAPITSDEILCAAVRLYGAVSIDELLEISAHYNWHPTRDCFIAEFEKAKAGMWPAIRIERGYAVHSFVGMQDSNLDLDNLIRLHSEYERYYPEDGWDFIDFADMEYCEVTPAMGRFRDYLADELKLKGDLAKRICKFIYWECLKGRTSDDLDEPVQSMIPMAIEDKDHLHAYLVAISMNARLMEFNGHSMAEDEPEYVDDDLVYEGRVQESGEVLKVGRNDPCPCGSGKKYKKCCGRP